MNKKSIFHLYYSNEKKVFCFLLYFTIIVGILVALFVFYYNNSLWLDETYLANNIISKSFVQLLKPLDDAQIAPIGYLYSTPKVKTISKII